MLLRAWIWLIVLSLLATVLALGQNALPPVAAKAVGLAILLISGKAAIILSDYLDLRAAPPILRGFRAGLGAFLAVAAALYLAG